MNSNTKLPKKQFYIIMVSLSIVIFALSLEVMMKVKDISLYNAWYENAVNDGMLMEYESAFSTYISINLLHFFQKLIIPMLLGLHAYISYIKIRINKLFVFMWIILICASIAYISIEMNFDSIFYYIEILLHIVVAITVLSLIDVIDNNVSS